MQLQAMSFGQAPEGHGCLAKNLRASTRHIRRRTNWEGDHFYSSGRRQGTRYDSDIVCAHSVLNTNGFVFLSVPNGCFEAFPSDSESSQRGCRPQARLTKRVCRFGLAKS